MDSGDLLALLALLAAGLAAGALNVVAGGGSFLTLPLLLFLGLPASEANGTNRVGVLAQNLAGVWGFHRHGVLDWRWAVAVSAPAMVGAAAGTWLALAVPDFAFRRILSLIMLGVTLGTLARNHFDPPGPGRLGELRSPWHWTIVSGFALVGIYGGFLQAGVGFLILSLTSIGGLDLVRGNAVKVLCVFSLTTLSLAIFAGSGRVQWPLGLALGLGNLMGGLLGVRLAVRIGHRWVERVVTVTIVVFAIMLWITE